MEQLNNVICVNDFATEEKVFADGTFTIPHIHCICALRFPELFRCVDIDCCGRSYW